MRPWLLFVLLAVIACGVGANAWARKEALLDVSEGQLPTDTGSDGKTTFLIETNKELGGAALKVVYADGDSVGDRIARIKDWTQFTTLEFSAYNPSPQNVRLILTVKHKRTVSYPTRVDVPLMLHPGVNAISIPIDSLHNVNESAPDLANVARWYLACEGGKTPIVYLGDIWLEGEAPPPMATATGGTTITGGLVLSGSYHIKGTIGGMPVDLTITPEATVTAAASPTPGTGGPAIDLSRLQRIRAATMPPVTKPVLFGTPEADAILSSLEVFPSDNPWNQIVSGWPVDPHSTAIVTSIGSDKPLRYNPDMGFVLVPSNQKRVDVKIIDYPGESDRGPYPVPNNVPIEGWPAGQAQDPAVQARMLADAQRDISGRGGDRHALVVDPANRMLYEFYNLRRTDAGWQAAQASIFDLKTNKLRPNGWTSSDAAGLPVFPAVVRYDELKRGSIDHALRVTVRRTRQEFVAPATHYASRLTGEDLPRMGERLRLRQDFDVSGFSPEARTILVALKKYGMFVADNGIEWAISVAPDERIPDMHEELRRVKGSDFEVVVSPR